MIMYIMRNGVIYETTFDENGRYELGAVFDTPAEDVVTQEVRLHNVDKSYYASKSSSISIEEIYNQIQITCSGDDIDDVIESPLVEDDIRSDYTNKQHYCREYVSWGEGKRAANAFINITHGKSTDYDAYEVHDWYVQQMRNDKWRFNTDQFLRTDNMYQCTVPRIMYTQNQYNRATLLKLGHIKNDGYLKDNSIVNNVDMKTYLVIALIGRGELVDEETHPTFKELYTYAPCAEYIGSKAVGRYSPIDSTTHNYFVISGKVVLNKRGFVTKRWKDLVETVDNREDIWHATIHLDDNKNGDGAYYAIQFFNNPTPQDKVDTEWFENTSFLTPWNSEWKNRTNSQYNKGDGDIDKIKYVPILVAQMKIGEYYLVDFQSQYSDFPIYEWRKYDDLPLFTDPNGNTRRQTFFSIGINPKTQDWLVGQQYSFANMISPDMCIENEEGIAIPLPYDKNLTGKIEFKILGPAWIQSKEGIVTYKKEWQTYYDYDETTGQYYEYQVQVQIESDASPFMNADSMWIEDLNIKIVSDNGGLENFSDEDIVYTTDENTNGSYVEVKDDIEFDIFTQLTPEEAYKKGFSPKVKINNPSIASTNEALREIKNMVTGDKGKPEELYLSNYWKEYQQPKILFTTEFKDTPIRSWTSHYKFNQWKDKQFFVQSENYNVKYKRKELTLKEM